MSQNVRVYAELIEAARGGSEGAERALRDFLRSSADTMPPDVLLDVSECILQSMRAQQSRAAEMN